MSENKIFQGWDSLETVEDFFSVIDKEEGISTEPVIPKEDENEDEEVSSKKDEEEKLESKEEDFFESFDEEDEEEDPNPKNEGEEEYDESSFFGALKEKGLVDFEEDDEEFSELSFEEKFETIVENKIKDKLDGLPQEVQRLVMHSLSGGDHREFLSSLNTSKKLSLDFDIEDEENQEFAVREFLKEDGEDESFITSQINFLKEEGRLEEYSRRRFNRWKKEEEKKQEQLLKEEKEKKENARKQLIEAKKSYQALLESEEDFGGIEVSKKFASQLPSYLTDKKVKLDNGSSLSEFQRDLFFEVPKNPKALIQLALLIKNRNKDGTFNFDSISKKIETKLSREIKNNVRRMKDNQKRSNSSSSPKSLADFF